MEEEIYLDYAAAAPVSIEALEVAYPFFSSEFFNPSSAHAAGQRAAAAVEKARALCASAIAASPREILFTSGGTDAVTKGITGIVSDRKRVVISDIEHECVERAAKELENRGFSVDEVHVGSDGIVSPEELKKKVGGDTALVCVLTVNNITGALQPIKQLCEAAHECGALFFTDAVQAVNAVDIDVRDWNVDMLAVAAHKFYGMKGAGFLYIKNGVPHLSPKKNRHEKRAGYRRHGKSHGSGDRKPQKQRKSYERRRGRVFERVKVRRADNA